MGFDRWWLLRLATSGALLVIFLVIIFVMEGRPTDYRAQGDSAQDLRILARACRQYAKDHASRTPECLSALCPHYIDDVRVFVHPRTGHTIEIPYQIDERADYVLVGGLDVRKDGTKILAYDKPGNQPGGLYNVVYLEGEIEQFAEEKMEVQQLLKEANREK